MSTQIVHSSDNWCLTCNKPKSRVPLVSDGKGFLVRPTFYGSWMYCNCPVKWIDQEMFSLANIGKQTRRLTMKWVVNAELVLQDEDKKATPPKTLITTEVFFDVEAEEFDAAYKLGMQILTDSVQTFNITGVGLKMEDAS